MFWNPNQRTAMSLLWLNLKLHVSSDHRGTPIEATFKGDMIRRRGLYLWPYIGGDYHRQQLITMHHVVRHSLHRIMVLGQISAEKSCKVISNSTFFCNRGHIYL